MRFPMGTGTLGWGIPAAVGVKLAAPEREVVTIGGDGATLYNAQELATMRRHGLKVTVVVANDDCFSAIKAQHDDAVRARDRPRARQPGLRAARRGVRRRRGVARRSGGPRRGVTRALAGDATTVIEVPLEMLPGTELYVGELADATAGA